jgi:arginase
MRSRVLLTPFALDEPAPALEALAEPGWSVNSLALPGGGPQRRMSALHGPIAEHVSAAVRAGDRPVSITGDCCTTLGVVAGLQRAGIDPAVLWLDAHGDFNTWETSPSGFIGGMPLAMLVGRGEQTMVEALGLHPLGEDRVILSDARDLDPEEGRAVEASGVHHVRDVRALVDHPLLDGPLYVHFDIDVIDPREAPAVRFRAPGGSSVADLGAVFDALARRGRIVAVSMTTWVPQLDEDGRSRALCMGLLRRLTGP